MIMHVEAGDAYVHARMTLYCVKLCTRGGGCRSLAGCLLGGGQGGAAAPSRGQHVV